MGITRAAFKSNQLGQSSVEYILLLILIVSLSLVLFRSRRFQDFIAEDNEMMNTLQGHFEMSYRHGHIFEGNNELNYDQAHRVFSDGQSSNFFVSIEPYED